MSRLLLVAALMALAVAGCDLPPDGAPTSTLVCHLDGEVTFRVPGHQINSRGITGPDGRMVTYWSIRTGPGQWAGHEAGPDEVCGPEQGNWIRLNVD